MPDTERPDIERNVTTVEVFADITCPFTHVGLKRIVQLVDETTEPVDVLVRAWPLEWINGAPMDPVAVQAKAKALCQQLDVDDFNGFRADRWPDSTVAALNLAASAYERDAATGLAVSLAVRTALFEKGLDISDPAILAEIAEVFDLPTPIEEPSAAVQADYAEGKDRGVTGSPHFWIDEHHDFFCPSLDLGRDHAGDLTAQFDTYGLEQFLAHLGQ